MRAGPLRYCSVQSGNAKAIDGKSETRPYRLAVLSNLGQGTIHAPWLILDNGRLALARDTKMVGSFVLNEDGTRRFVPSNPDGQGSGAGRSSSARFVRPA